MAASRGHWEPNGTKVFEKGYKCSCCRNLSKKRRKNMTLVSPATCCWHHILNEDTIFKRNETCQLSLCYFQLTQCSENHHSLCLVSFSWQVFTDKVVEKEGYCPQITKCNLFTLQNTRNKQNSTCPAGSAGEMTRCFVPSLTLCSCCMNFHAS